ncbi:hypothetical protein EVAR_8411_1 [Eumeta japonica]|uniref:Uncharacterized protein n=1 Tax=Eumeta variegata TaxID=151549 RepID=A0A4C1WCM8_EUMVA|nr:hypothetical protein EVAR_8411_1 [Eumeta japonica]
MQSDARAQHYWAEQIDVCSRTRTEQRARLPRSGRAIVRAQNIPARRFTRILFASRDALKAISRALPTARRLSALMRSARRLCRTTRTAKQCLRIIGSQTRRDRVKDVRVCDRVPSHLSRNANKVKALCLTGVRAKRKHLKRNRVVSRCNGGRRGRSGGDTRQRHDQLSPLSSHNTSQRVVARIETYSTRPNRAGRIKHPRGTPTHYKSYPRCK